MSLRMSLLEKPSFLFKNKMIRKLRVNIITPTINLYEKLLLEHNELNMSSHNDGKYSFCKNSVNTGNQRNKSIPITQNNKKFNSCSEMTMIDKNTNIKPIMPMLENLDAHTTVSPPIQGLNNPDNNLIQSSIIPENHLHKNDSIRNPHTVTKVNNYEKALTNSAASLHTSVTNIPISPSQNRNLQTIGHNTAQEQETKNNVDPNINIASKELEVNTQIELPNRMKTKSGR